jgi:hypothetical protein
MNVAMLQPAEYELTVLSAGIQNSTGTRMQENYFITFHVQPGDLNGDQITNDLDLFRLWQVLLRPVSERNPEFDINGDGQVNAGDMSLLKASYLNTTSAGLAPRSRTNQEPRSAEAPMSMAALVLAPWLRNDPDDAVRPLTRVRKEARL